MDLTPFPAAAFLASLPWTLSGLLLLLAVTFVIGVRQHRHAVMDCAWGLGFVVVAAISWVLSEGHGDPARRLLLLGLTAVWGLRLAGYLAWRLRDGAEDPRYAGLLGPGSRNLRALRLVHLPQGATLFLVSLTTQVGMHTTGPVTWVAWVGVGLWAVGMAFEVAGDWQLVEFRMDPANRGRILDTGVWAWSRHPNYFGDSAVWWGIFLVSASSWPGVLTVFSPVLMTWVLVARTGKALTEARMMERPGYRAYVLRTSGFIPLPPRR